MGAGRGSNFESSANSVFSFSRLFLAAFRDFSFMILFKKRDHEEKNMDNLRGRMRATTTTTVFLSSLLDLQRYWFLL